MYKCIIVDDEKYICEGLSRLEWSRVEIEIVASFCHGLAACQFLSENPDIDIIFADVQMPIMNGLQLIQYAKKKYPYVKVIILSGYDEFNYVQQAIRLGVSDYILKPINEDALFQTAREVIKKLTAEKTASQKLKALERKANEQTKRLRKQYIQDVLFKKLPEETREEICTYGEILLDSACYTVLVYRLDSVTAPDFPYRSEDWKLILFGLENILDEIVDDKDIGYNWIDHKSGYCYLLLTAENLQRSKETLTAFAEELKENIYRIQGLLRSTVSVCIGSTEHHAGAIYLSCCNAEQELKNSSDDETVLQCLEREAGEGQSEPDEVPPEADCEPFDYESGKCIVEKVKEYIAANYQTNITLTEAAAQVYLNPSYLSCIFKEVQGVNFIHYLTDYRVQKAAELLKNPKYKIYEVGELVGYDNSRYFTKIFKKYIGKTPINYRNS
ncbi:MAG: response regulator [Angelakisella sp.]